MVVGRSVANMEGGAKSKLHQNLQVFAVAGRGLGESFWQGYFWQAFYTLSVVLIPADLVSISLYMAGKMTKIAPVFLWLPLTGVPLGLLGGWP